MSSEYTAQRVARSDLDDRLQAQKSIAEVLTKECSDLRAELSATQSALWMANQGNLALVEKRQQLTAELARAEKSARDTFEYETQMAEYKDRAEKAEARLAEFVKPETLPHSIDDATMREWDLCRDLDRAQKQLAEARKALVSIISAGDSLRNYDPSIDSHSELEEIWTQEKDKHAAAINAARKAQADIGIPISETKEGGAL